MLLVVLLTETRAPAKPLKWNRIHVSEIRFRSHWFLLFVFCAVVTVEWVLRKKEGLLSERPRGAMVGPETHHPNETRRVP